jgi:hypothetical protein
MSHSHEPHYQADGAWAGDSLQLCLKTDRTCHVTAWYYAAKKEAAIRIGYGKSLTEPFGGGERTLYQTRGAEMTGGAAMACRFADNLMPGQTSREFFWQAVNAWGPVTIVSGEPASRGERGRRLHPDADQRFAEVTMAHQVVWFDLPVLDLDRAIAFYSAVLGTAVKKDDLLCLPPDLLTASLVFGRLRCAVLPLTGQGSRPAAGCSRQVTFLRVRRITFVDAAISTSHAAAEGRSGARGRAVAR